MHKNFSRLCTYDPNMHTLFISTSYYAAGYNGIDCKLDQFHIASKEVASASNEQSFDFNCQYIVQ